MTWVRLDEMFPISEKALKYGLTSADRDLFVCLLCHCNRTLSDGRFVGGCLAVASPLHPGRGRALASLLAAGMVVEVGRDEYVIHDYHDYQPRAEDVKAMRAAKSAGGKARAAQATRSGGKFLPAENQQSAGAYIDDATSRKTSSDQQAAGENTPDSHQQNTSSLSPAAPASDPIRSDPIRSTSTRETLPLPPRPKKGIPEEVHRIWEMWPKNRQGIEHEIVVWWQANRPTQSDASMMLEVLPGFLLSDEWDRESGRFVPKPVVWLNQKRWAGPIPPPRSAAASKPALNPETTPTLPDVPPEILAEQRERAQALIRETLQSLPRAAEEQRTPGASPAPTARMTQTRAERLADLLASGASEQDVADLAQRAGYTADEVSGALAAADAAEEGQP